MRVLTAQQMREADRRASAAGVPSIALMENAGREVASAMAAAFPDLASCRVAVVAGRGNNGGDGFVVARLLRGRGIDVRAVLLGRGADLRGDAATNLQRLREHGLAVTEVTSEAEWAAVGGEVLACDLIVDAIVGTGATAPLAGLAAGVVGDINEARKRVVAIDLPSGLIADRTDVPGEAIQATLTVALGTAKLALTQPPANALSGTLVVADIGIPTDVVARLEGPWIELLTKEFARRLLPARRHDVHKGELGRILIVAGSPGKTGAASLAGLSALRSGAGLVTIATPASSMSTVATLGREYMTLALDEDGDGLVTPAALARVLQFDADVIAAGPGLGRSAGVTAFVRGLLERATRPLVLDADALHAVAGAPKPSRPLSPPIALTPHPGEMAALTGMTPSGVQAQRLDVARAYATEHGVTVVLKGANTVIAAPDGRLFINSTGNPGMATAGTGDVLTGAIAAWAAQLRPIEDACALAVYLHGAAGDLAAAEEGESGLIAGDVLARLGRASRDLAAAAPPLRP
ncbi:MAG TPA: NAD(P)H-hydrate dehydratase [Vicinamibacterales bacterium]|nr:NAD(P)H-hydrate dehydratase [Vicinamibacterales bacterium]